MQNDRDHIENSSIIYLKAVQLTKDSDLFECFQLIVWPL